jgi:hypothetical protein
MTKLSLRPVSLLFLIPAACLLVFGGSGPATPSWAAGGQSPLAQTVPPRTITPGPDRPTPLPTIAPNPPATPGAPDSDDDNDNSEGEETSGGSNSVQPPGPAGGLNPKNTAPGSIEAGPNGAAPAEVAPAEVAPAEAAQPAVTSPATVEDSGAGNGVAPAGSSATSGGEVKAQTPGSSPEPAETSGADVPAAAITAEGQPLTWLYALGLGIVLLLLGLLLVRRQHQIRA